MSQVVFNFGGHFLISTLFQISVLKSIFCLFEALIPGAIWELEEVFFLLGLLLTVQQHFTMQFFEVLLIFR